MLAIMMRKESKLYHYLFPSLAALLVNYEMSSYYLLLQTDG